MSELKPGVLSWVSTVEEVAKKAAVSVKGAPVKPAKLCIPPYQRKFAWKEQDVRQLCKDLLKAGDDGNYHLGTVILHHERKNDEEVWNIVDGQQRLTNIMAILGAPIFELPIKQFLTRDYVMIRQVMAGYSADEQLKIRERLARCTLTFISVENVSEAFQLFTTQNGHGEQLKYHEIMKAELLAKLHQKCLGDPSVGDYDKLASMFDDIWTACSRMNGYVGHHLHACSQYLDRPEGGWTDTKEWEKFQKPISSEVDKTGEALEQSVIWDFANFLMHALKSYQKKYIPNSDVIVTLDERDMQVKYDALKEFIDPVLFLDLLIRLRLRFDKYVVKAENDANGDKAKKSKK